LPRSRHEGVIGAWRSGSIHLNPVTSWRWGVTFTPRPLTGSHWTPENIWTFRRKNLWEFTTYLLSPRSRILLQRL